MKSAIKRLSILLLIGAAALALPAGTGTGTADAEEWPPKEMLVIVPHGVGGTTNRLARALGEVWQEYLGTKFIFENKKGASTRIGHDYFMRQPRDGTVLIATNLSTALIMHAQQKPGWNWEESIHPLGLYSVDPAVIFVAKDAPFKSFADVIEVAKTKPLTFAISQWQSEDNLLIHQIMENTGAQFEVIPHDVSSQALAQVMGGNIDLGILKVGPASRGGDAIRMLALAMPENPIPDLTGGAPSVSEAIGSAAMSVASYRAFVVHQEVAEKYPERVAKLKETYKQALQDKRYIDAAIKAGVSPKLILDLSTEEIQKQIVEPVRENFKRFGGVFKKK